LLGSAAGATERITDEHPLAAPAGIEAGQPHLEQAAAAPISGFAALQALRDTGGVQPGQKVVVIGASGGVGSFAVQLAKAFGAQVTGVCSTRSVEMVRSIGADQVIDYTKEDFTPTGRRHDLILEMAGNRALARSHRSSTGPSRSASLLRRAGMSEAAHPRQTVITV
jgi:NADPH:quinone reductase-like Zn-dependent oxidoreductase